MKVVILAGGLGTRISEESHLKPKPMIEIGEMPILVHIMKIYASQGFKDFVICAGYKQQIIKEYFAHYYLYMNDVTFHMGTNKKEVIHSNSFDDWNVTVADTGLNTATGGRVKRIQKYIGEEPFMLTYGDAVGDIDLKALLECHIKSHKIGTMTVYNFGQSKGVVDVSKDGTVNAFREKSDFDGDLINIGFMVMEPQIFDYIHGDDEMFEGEPMKRMVLNHQLNAYYHKGFWQCMDTMNEKNKLEQLWISGKAPWKVWKD
jgi:glucose-1-phosphate cytidylyltransferase